MSMNEQRKEIKGQSYSILTGKFPFYRRKNGYSYSLCSNFRRLYYFRHSTLIQHILHDKIVRENYLHIQ